MKEVPVLIVGGGPVGLGLAIDLGWRGIDCMLVEQTDGKIFHPRANAINSRTMEFCRRWGIAEAVREAGAPPDFPSTILYVTSMQGYEIARIERPTHGGRTSLPHTPERPQRCNQLWFDPILRDRAASFPSVDLRYRTRFESFERTGDGVIATVTDLESGRGEQIAVRYLVSCCGGRSSIPKSLGAGWEGTLVLSYNLNIYLRVPEIWAQTGREKAAFYVLVGADGSQRILVELDGDSLWRMGIRNVDAPLEPEDVDLDAAVQSALGPGVSYEIISALPWVCRSIVSDRYSDGPVILAGDAVHQHAPSGGFGMNTGMGDAADLGWKLAGAVEGWAGSSLVASYAPERKPVAQRNVAEATDNNEQEYDPALLPDIERADEAGRIAREKLAAQILQTRSKTFISDGIALGYCYDGSPVICADGTPPPDGNAMRYSPTTRPGARAPHAWLSEGKSTLDLFGRNYVLMRFDGAGEGGLPDAAAKRRVPFSSVAVDDPDIATLYERKLVLVRPDGHVCWRGDAPPDDPLAVIDRVRGAA